MMKSNVHEGGDVKIVLVFTLLLLAACSGIRGNNNLGPYVESKVENTLRECGVKREINWPISGSNTSIASASQG